MRPAKDRILRTRTLVTGLPSIVGLSIAVGAWAGCGGAGSEPTVDSRFAAQTADENGTPLRNAIIGTPEGTTRIGADGVATKVAPVSSGGGGSVMVPPPPVDAGPIESDGGSGPIDSGPPPFGDGGDDGGDGGAGGFGQWHFDDCSPTSNFLVDSSGGGANAQHALNGSCVPGISNLGVAIRSAKDIVQVPDEPQFTVTNRVAVSAWVHPNTTTGDQPIVLKRLNSKTSFSLGVHSGNVEMQVVLDDGTTVISKAPIAAGTWSNVAGMFDGTFLFLFINGQQFGQVYAAGNLRNVFAPVRIGATTGSQYFDGIIDEVFVSTAQISKDSLSALSCLRKPSTLAVTPPISGPVQPDTTFTYTATITNNDVGFCETPSYEVFPGFFDPNIQQVFGSNFFPIPPGTSATTSISVTANDQADPGDHVLQVNGFRFTKNGPSENFSSSFVFQLAEPSGCFVSVPRELMIRDTSVVDDPVRTSGVFFPNGGFGDGGVGSIDAGTILGPPPTGFSSGPIGSASSSATAVGPAPTSTVPFPVPVPTSTVPVPVPLPAPDGGPINPASLGVWTLGHVLRDLAPSPAQAPAMVEQLFRHWLTDQTVNTFTVAARPAIQQAVLDAWPRTPDGQFDLDRSPFTLNAIVNRLDLRNLAAGSAGEGRLVFALNGPFSSENFTLILEFNLPAKTQADVDAWASLWHGLQSHPFPSEEYNAALEAIVARFAGRNSDPNGINGSALINLRTNEQILSPSFTWELREFNLNPTTGFFDEATVKETPDLRFNNTQTFSDFVNQNGPAIKALVPGAAGVLPTNFENAPFMAGSVLNLQVPWDGPGIVDDEARFHASMNTCNGCHGPGVGVFNFLQIAPRSIGSQSILSSFLTGTTVTDGQGVTRTLNDLSRRKVDMQGLVCGTDGRAPPPPPPPPVAASVGPPPPDAGVVLK